MRVHFPLSVLTIFLIFVIYKFQLDYYCLHIPLRGIKIKQSKISPLHSLHPQVAQLNYTTDLGNILHGIN